MFRIALAVTCTALAVAPASASADAVCSLQFDVRFEHDGRFTQQGAGVGQCVGNVAGSALDPAAANPSIAGRAGEGCAPETGTLVLRPRRAFEMWTPEHLELAGDWRAVGGALSGTLVTDSTAVTIAGTVGFTSGCSGSGRLHMDFVLGNERPAPRSAGATGPAPAADEPAAAAKAKPKKSKARRRKACRRAKAGSRAAKRCRRAARRS